MRVIFIPDCGAWSQWSEGGATEFLLDAIAYAFPDDEYVANQCGTVSTRGEVEKFLQVFTYLFIHLKTTFFLKVVNRNSRATVQRKGCSFTQFLTNITV